jgi:hypothetical protein
VEAQCLRKQPPRRLSGHEECPMPTPRSFAELLCPPTHSGAPQHLRPALGGVTQPQPRLRQVAAEYLVVFGEAEKPAAHGEVKRFRLLFGKGEIPARLENPRNGPCLLTLQQTLSQRLHRSWRGQPLDVVIAFPPSNVQCHHQQRNRPHSDPPRCRCRKIPTAG